MTIEKIKIGTVEAAYDVFLNVPELDRYLSLDDIRSRLADGALILIYEIADVPVAFKIGYPLNSDEFYSWLGGVLPNHRKAGIAQQLLDYQERWVKEQGYRTISVNSMNRYPSMIRLLVRNGYRIFKVDDFDTDEERIRFRKILSDR